MAVSFKALIVEDEATGLAPSFFLKKPVNDEELLRALREALPGAAIDSGARAGPCG